MFYRRVGMDRFYLFTDYTVLEQLMESKFSVIDQFREEAKNRGATYYLKYGILAMVMESMMRLVKWLS